MMSSLAAITRSLSIARIGAFLLPVTGVGTTDASRWNRSDLAGLERDLPGAPHIGPPFLVLFALGFAHEVQRLILAEHAGDGKLHVASRLGHHKSVGNNVGRGLGLRGLLQLTTRDDEISSVLPLIAVHVDGRRDQPAVDL